MEQLGGEKPLVKSIMDLTRQKEITVDDLMATMEAYSNGAGITASLVIELIERVQMTQEQTDSLIGSLKRGKTKQKEQELPKDVAEYQKVLDHLENRYR